MPRKELDQPWWAARGTTATDMTTRSALQRHITSATSDATFIRSGTAYLAMPTNGSILSAVQATLPDLPAPFRRPHAHAPSFLSLPPPAPPPLPRKKLLPAPHCDLRTPLLGGRSLMSPPPERIPSGLARRFEVVVYRRSQEQGWGEQAAAMVCGGGRREGGDEGGAAREILYLLARDGGVGGGIWCGERGAVIWVFPSFHTYNFTDLARQGRCRGSTCHETELIPVTC